jgi:hypothetical protein
MTDSFEDLDSLLENSAELPAKRGPGRPKKATTEPKVVEVEIPHANFVPELEASAAPSVDAVVEDQEDARLRELQELLATPEPELVAPRPTPVEELTPKQRQIREMEDLLAQRKARALTSAEPVFDTTSGEDRILIHFTTDGFTAQGVTWMRGQQVEFVMGSQAYEQTKNRFGVSWLDLVDDDAAQYRKYGEVKFRRGPWRGARYDDVFAREDETRGLAAPLIR